MEELQQYIEIVKKEFNQYMLMIFENGYNKEIFDRYLNEYIDIRYFNKNQNIKQKKDLYKSVINELEKVAKILIRTYDEEQLLRIKEVFSYIIYWDNIGKYDKNENIINKIIEFRKVKLNIKSNASFEKKMIKEINKRKEQKEEYIKRFLGQDFKIKNKKTSKTNLFLTELTHNIIFPNSISNKIIKQVFNTGTTLEDKLLIEYHMINALIIQDIVRGEFYKEYIAEFATTLLNKKSKLTKLLKIIEGEMQQERINLLIEYKDFTEENKNDIYGLMRQGFRVATKIDETFEFEENSIKKLNVFSYIIVKDKQDYSKLEKYKEISKKIIKI